ncbi:hypothetical protein E2C01_060472 [Portunus trituberculatus]|uniref:Uncharacterized protein n=1 Tax=Portunus trituberculatus TaxID=210409 RepID=A0A5B7H9J4_PORTR|nr:hypothetical protein [Portunus trituberculatus]
MNGSTRQSVFCYWNTGDIGGIPLILSATRIPAGEQLSQTRELPTILKLGTGLTVLLSIVIVVECEYGMANYWTLGARIVGYLEHE